MIVFIVGVSSQFRGIIWYMLVLVHDIDMLYVVNVLYVFGYHWRGPWTRDKEKVTLALFLSQNTIKKAVYLVFYMLPQFWSPQGLRSGGRTTNSSPLTYRLQATTYRSTVPVMCAYTAAFRSKLEYG